MTFPALPDLTTPHDDDLAAVRQRLTAVRASLQKACDELDAQIAALGELSPALATAQKAFAKVQKNSISLFETEPVPPVPESDQHPSAGKPKPVSAHWSTTTQTAIVLEAKGPMQVAPDLEQSTLDELNKALTKAFSQMARRPSPPWAG